MNSSPDYARFFIPGNSCNIDAALSVWQKALKHPPAPKKAAEDQLIDSEKGALQLTQTFGGGWKEWLAAQENAGRNLHEWNGQENPNAGFFVVERPSRHGGPGEIVAQSWAWVSDDGNLVFDNVEAKKLGCRDPIVRKIYQKTADDRKDQFPIITIGAGAGDLNLEGLPDAGDKFQKLPKGHNGNSDAKDRQVLLAEKKESP